MKTYGIVEFPNATHYSSSFAISPLRDDGAGVLSTEFACVDVRVDHLFDVIQRLRRHLVSHRRQLVLRVVLLSRSLLRWRRHLFLFHHHRLFWYCVHLSFFLLLFYRPIFWL